MKRYFLFSFLLMCLTVSGCTPQQVDGEAILSTESAQQSVENIFTTPTETADDIGMQPGSSFFSHRFATDAALTYEGGELHVPFQCAGVGIGGEIGYLLILDGRPQPYKLTDDGEYSYMHTLSPIKMATEFEFIFTPITGNAGDTLELYAVNVLDPDHRVSEDGILGSKHTSGSIPVMNTIHYLAEPDLITAPEEQNRILDMGISCTDITATEIAGWTDEELRSRSDCRISVNDRDNIVTFWNTSTDEPIRVHLELWGNPDAEFGVIFYLNGQPVSLDEADMLVRNEQGKKLTMDIQIDNADLEKESILYAVIVYRNLHDISTEGIQWFAHASTYYFMSQEEPAY